MYSETPKDRYQAAFDEAAFELRKIQQEFETLSLRRERIAKVVDVLKPKVSFENLIPTDNLSITSRCAGLTVVTRLSIMSKLPEE